MSIIEKALKKRSVGEQSEATENSGSIAKAMTRKVTPETAAKNHVASDNGNKVAVTTLHIDTERLKKEGMVAYDDDNANAQINNEYRSIKHKILYNAFGPASSTLKKSNMVMITSAQPVEGKTFTAINLAFSVATEKDKTILLVDADVLRPNISRTLGVEETPGLIDYLLGDVSNLSDVIYPTNIPNLRILPAGSAHHLSNELLASDRMKSLTTELENRYPDRLVLFDCPPMLGVVETVTVSQLMGQAIIVVSHTSTQMSDVEQTIADLNRDLAIGFVINKALYGTHSQYGYGYDYGTKPKKV
ncbi:XrtA-associated tyrosine autokinase [Photobacterium makurazakiensis]|uniref:XrtA-associated tyrosine autokinase n=1 Tax=Photobacterium makurazakiensis TaxID=2910234 RepID=UPI003D124CF6